MKTLITATLLLTSSLAFADDSVMEPDKAYNAAVGFFDNMQPSPYVLDTVYEAFPEEISMEDITVTTNEYVASTDEFCGDCLFD